MKIKLIENGLDSLKKGFEYLKQYEEQYLLEKSGHERYFILKDAILSIHHGIEILFKEVLRKSNELLIYSDIDKSLKNAYVEKRQRKLYSLFETSQTLHTVRIPWGLPLNHDKKHSIRIYSRGQRMPGCSLYIEQKTLNSGLRTAGLTDRRKAPTKDQMVR